MEMFLDVVGDMGVTGKSGNESCSCVQYSLKGRKQRLCKADQQRITVVMLVKPQVGRVRAVWARGHLGASRLGAVLIKNRHSPSGSEVKEKS